jgi:hypothetical protein
MSLVDEIDIFYGALSEHSAHVYVRLPNTVGGGEWSFAGQVHGPFCKEVRTLPLIAKLQDLGAGPTLLARAVVPDPATWNPLSPAYYCVTVEVRLQGEVVQRIERRLGLRSLGARGRDLRWEGKRWVLRGICVAEEAIGELDLWREHNAAPIVSRPSEQLLEEAGNAGVLVAVELGIDATDRDVRRLASFPAVGIVLLPASCKDVASLKSVAPNLLFAQAVQNDMAAAEEGPHFLLYDASRPDLLPSQLAASPRPIVAVRRVAERGSFIDNRAACDRLQSDLATLGDFAGYVV